MSFAVEPGTAFATSSRIPHAGTVSGGVIDSTGTYMYALNHYAQKLEKINTAGMTVAASIDLSGFPKDIEIESDNSDLYVLTGSSVVKVDLNSFTINATYALNMSPEDMTVGISGSTILVSGTILGNSNSTAVQVVKPLLQTVSTVYVVSASAGGWTHVAIENDEQFGYITLDRRIYKMNMTTGSFTVFLDFSSLNTPTYGVNASQILIDTNNEFLFVVNSYGEVIKINLSSREFTIVGMPPVADIWSVKFDANENFIYVAGRSRINFVDYGAILKVNLKTLKVARSDYSTSTTERWGFNALIFDSARSFHYVAYEDEFLKFQTLSTEPQSIEFTSISNSYYGNRTVSLAAAASSGLPISFASLTPGTCQVSNQTVSFIAVGSCSIKASQLGGFGWDAATDVIRTFDILPQTILFNNIADVLSNAGQISLTASATSGLPIAFTSSSPDVCEVQNNSNVLTIKKSGQCRVGADQSGNQFWDAAQQANRAFSVLPAPPIGEQGISINSGSVYTNTKKVQLNLVWPSFASEVRISNDGGFLTSLTQNRELSSTIDWELDDSIEGKYTKIVYVRFSGTGIDSTKTYTDDIILDNTAPIIKTVDAIGGSGATQVDFTGTSNPSQLKNFTSSKQVVKYKIRKIRIQATDNKSGLGKLQVSLKMNGNGSKLLKYSSTSKVKLSVNTKFIYIRIQDKAGNFSRWKKVSVK